MQEESSLKFAERLKGAMADSGLKAARLAESACISKGYLSELLKGTKETPSFEVVKKFADILGRSPKWLLTGQTDPPATFDWRVEDSTVREDEVPYRFPPMAPQCQGHDSPELLAVLLRIAAALEKLAERE